MSRYPALGLILSMSNIKVALWGMLIGLSVLWIIAAPSLPREISLNSIRNPLLQYSGVLAIGAMSVAMILAVRAPWLERWLDGLDKSYRLHKWLGITALVVSVVHWVTANGSRWLINLGLRDRTPRSQHGGAHDFGVIQAFFQEHRHLAVLFGEWAFYAAALLIVLALIKRFPYKLFISTHTLIALAYLALAFHSIVLMQFNTWVQPVGIITGLLIAGGVASGVLSLTRQIGRSRQVSGTIASVKTFPEMQTTEIDIALQDGWTGHDAGQFAFVTFDRREGKHPFTIASAWDPTAQYITFLAKGLGDYTDTLPDAIKVGGEAKIEGPYGRFTFDCANERQIWIAGGIGITPFMARMKELAEVRDQRPIDLMYSASDVTPDVLEALELDAAASGVTLHHLSGKDGRLTGERLRTMVPDWASASVWFCGPAAFGHAIRRDLIMHGLSARDFHQELFEMR